MAVLEGIYYNNVGQHVVFNSERKLSDSCFLNVYIKEE